MYTRVIQPGKLLPNRNVFFLLMYACCYYDNVIKMLATSNIPNMYWRNDLPMSQLAVVLELGRYMNHKYHFLGTNHSENDKINVCNTPVTSDWRPFCDLTTTHTRTK